MLRKWKSLLFFVIFLAILSALFVVIMTTENFDTKPKVSNIPENPIYLDSSQPIGERVADLLSYMTIEEKIGQMTLVEKNSLKKVSDIKTYHLGSLLSGSGAKPEENTVQGWTSMIDSYQAEAKNTRLGIPLLYGSDAIHGHAHVPEATVFPHAIGLGATDNPELIKQVAKATAEELQTTRVNWNFAPNLDMSQDIRWGRTYETFGDDPELIGTLGASYLEGLQSDEPNRVRVLGTAKHFVGLGAMGWNTSTNENFKIDQGVTEENEELLLSEYIPPFVDAIDAGALSIMVGLNTWGNERIVRQKHLLTNLLKQELGFEGFVVSDWYGVHEGTRNSFFATVAAVNSGVDMVMLPFDYETFTRHMKWSNRLGLIPDERIDDAVSRILYAKFSLGLFDVENEIENITTIPNEKNKALARNVVAQSLVLLKNEKNTLPIKSNRGKIFVAGSAADNVGQQMGAWSIEWQGVDGNWLPRATSILEGIESQSKSYGLEVEYSRLGEFSTDVKKGSIGIAVVGEKPYAEGWGDNPKPSLSEEDLDVIKNLREVADEIVVVMVTGRPLIISEEINGWDSVIVAWLPGSEGAGVADVIFGKKSVTGTLPLPWPASINQLPIQTSGKTADDSELLFPRYFGLRY